MSKEGKGFCLQAENEGRLALAEPDCFYPANFLIAESKEAPAALHEADYISERLSGHQAFAFSASTGQAIRVPDHATVKELEEDPLPALLENWAGSVEEKKVLLVEENRVHQLLTRKFLQKWGFKIHGAGNGQEAVRMARAQPYDLILMDLNMPGMNGYAAAEIIRSISFHYSQIPILAFTASAVEQVKTEDRKAVFTDILMKPFKPETLYTNIHKHLYAAREEINLNPLQAKLDGITRGDNAFKKQLVDLYLKSFREILKELKDGKMLEIDYLRHVRHKHKATFEMLGLGIFARQLLQMQENLSLSQAETDCVKTINQQGEQIIKQLESVV